MNYLIMSGLGKSNLLLKIYKSNLFKNDYPWLLYIFLSSKLKVMIKSS